MDGLDLAEIYTGEWPLLGNMLHRRELAAASANLSCVSNSRSSKGRLCPHICHWPFGRRCKVRFLHNAELSALVG